MLKSPWTSKGGIKIGSLHISKDTPQTLTQMRIKVSEVQKAKGKQALFFVFSSATAEQSICELHDLVFIKC